MIYDILDARGGEVREGPWSKEDADKLCKELNWFVLQNTMPLLAALCKEPENVKGPFYPVKRK